MSKILITGNGFDLFHYLPTKYHHFISIMKTIENQNYDRMLFFEDIFGKSFKVDFPNDFNLIVENYNTDEFIFDFNKVNELSNLLNVNPWYKYFKNVLEVDTWIDFEIEIEVVLNQLSIFKKYDDKSIIRNNRFRDPLMKETDFDLFDLIKHQASSSFTINEKYINNRKGSIDIKKVLEDLAISFEDFIVIFNRYLVDIVSVFYSHIKQRMSIPFHLMDKIYTFNYTPTLEAIYKVQKSKVVYLHGEINEDCSKQNLVLGVCEISKNIKKHKIFDFTKYYQKINKSCNMNFVKINSKNSTYDEETFFYIIGHSLDKSDNEYILDLFNFLEADKLDKSKICIFYYDNKDRENKIRNLLSVVEEKIVSKMNKEERLNFVKLNERNLNDEFNKVPYKHQVIF